MATAREIVRQAEAWIGLNEADKTHRQIIDLYNKQKPLARGYKVKYTDAWCATFVSAVAIKCNATDIIPLECGCQEQITLWKKMGRWIEDENRIPSAGDYIYYDWQDDGKGDNKGHADHVGIVQKVKDNKIYVIEGNYHNRVEVRIIAVNAKCIRGYAIPEYATEKSLDEIAKEVIAGKHGNGTERRLSLISEGYDYDAVQEKVNELLTKSEKDLTAVARDVIAGKYGNGTSRKKKLEAAGYDYKAVQKKVNELLK